MNQSGKSNSVEPDTGDPVLMSDVSAEEPRVDDATSSEGYPGKSNQKTRKNPYWPTLLWIALGWAPTWLYWYFLNVLLNLSREFAVITSRSREVTLIIYGALVVGIGWIITGLAIRKQYALTRKQLITLCLTAIGVGVLAGAIEFLIEPDLKIALVLWGVGLEGLLVGLLLKRSAQLSVGQIVALTFGWTLMAFFEPLFIPYFIGVINMFIYFIIGIRPLAELLALLVTMFSGALIGLTGGWFMIDILESARKRAAELKK